VMQRLTKSQETARAVLLDDLRGAAAEVKGAVEEINRLVVDRLNVAVANYNEAVNAVKDIQEEVAKAQHEYWHRQPNEWQESFEGRAYDTWQADWDLLDLDELDDCIELDVPPMDHADDLEKLPSEPEPE